LTQGPIKVAGCEVPRSDLAAPVHAEVTAAEVHQAIPHQAAALRLSPADGTGNVGHQTPREQMRRNSITSITTQTRITCFVR